MRTLEAYQSRCLRYILNIKWSDKITNVEVRTRAGISSLESIITERRLLWAGKVAGLPSDRIEHACLWGMLGGNFKKGRPVYRWEDNILNDSKSLKLGAWWEAAVKHYDNFCTIVKSLASVHNSWEGPERIALCETVCSRCSKVCHTNAGLLLHERHCKGPDDPDKYQCCCQKICKSSSGLKRHQKVCILFSLRGLGD